MSDFTYDSDDFAGIRAAATNLKNNEYSALIGATLAISVQVLYNASKVSGSNAIWRKAFQTRVGPALLAGSLGYITT